MIFFFIMIVVVVAEACVGGVSDAVRLIRARVRTYALLPSEERSEFESLLTTANHTLAFLCGMDQVVADPFDYADGAPIDFVRSATSFRLLSDDRRWLDALLPHYAAFERPRVAWMAIALRYWVEELGAPLMLVLELLWRLNELKRDAVPGWSAADVERYLVQSDGVASSSSSSPDSLRYRSNVLAALHDGGGLAGAALCRLRDDDDVQRTLPTLTRWYDRRRLLRNVHVLLPLPPRHFEAVARFVALGVAGFDASVLPAGFIGDLVPLDVDLRADVAAQHCWR